MFGECWNVVAAEMFGFWEGWNVVAAISFGFGKGLNIVSAMSIRFGGPLSLLRRVVKSSATLRQKRLQKEKASPNICGV